MVGTRPVVRRVITDQEPGTASRAAPGSQSSITGLDDHDLDELIILAAAGAGIVTVRRRQVELWTHGFTEVTIVGGESEVGASARVTPVG